MHSSLAHATAPSWVGTRVAVRIRGAFCRRAPDIHFQGFVSGRNPMYRRMQLVAFGLSGILGASYLLHGQTSPQQDDSKAEGKNVPKISVSQPMSYWMDVKLNSSKSILEALAKGDFEKLESEAEHMRLIGKLEDFVRYRNPEYTKQLQTFQLANQELIRQAKRHNVEGATLAFNHLTTSCVACHVMLRSGIEE